MAGGVNGTIIMNSPYFRFNLLATLLLIIVSIILNFMLIPSYGISGAAIATMTSLFLYNITKSFYIYLKYRIQPISVKVIPIILVSIILICISFQIDTIMSTYVDIAVRSILILVLYSLSMVYFRISHEVENYWKKILRYMRFKIT